MANSQSLRRFVLLSAILNAIVAVPLSVNDRSARSSSVELIIKSAPATNYTVVDNDAADSSRSLEQLEDDLSSGENSFALQLLNTTDEATNSFAVRLARALRKMQFSQVPPTIVLNDKEVVEHTHVEEEPALQPARDVGHFAVAARPPPPSSSAQSQPRAPVNAVASSKMGNAVRRNFASAMRSAAVAPPAGNSGADCCDSVGTFILWRPSQIKSYNCLYIFFIEHLQWSSDCNFECERSESDESTVQPRLRQP